MTLSRRVSLLCVWAIALGVVGGSALAAPPKLLSAVSRLPHAAAGDFDTQLPLTGGSGIECRFTPDGIRVALKFDQAVVAGFASVTAGTASVVGTPTVNANTMTVVLTGVTNGQSITLTTAGVANAASEVASPEAVPLRTIFGDVNGDGRLSTADISVVRYAVGVGAAVDAGNYRCDLNADGRFSTADVSAVRSAVGVGTTVDGGPTNNTAPTLSGIGTQSVVTGLPMSPVGFTVADAESDAGTLVVTWASSDQVTIPNANIAVTGAGASRAITLTPAAGVTVTKPVTVTLYVSDGLANSTPVTFTVNVTPPPLTYLATLGPVPGTNSLGTGTATLTVSGDRTFATLVYNYSNLSTADTDDAIYDGSAGVMYDIPVGKARGDQQPDGSYRWTFNTTKAPDILTALQSNTSYILLESSKFPAGELVGIFKPLSGSQTFTPPAAPPSLTINPPVPADASRFLQQAAFGGTSSEIAALSDPSAANASKALNDWLTFQFNTPVPIYPTYGASAIAPTTQPLGPQASDQPYSPSSMYRQIYNRVTVAQAPNAYGDTLDDNRVHEAWWKNAVTAPDALRQRVATAYSEIFVVSERDGTVDGNIPGLASYYDMLAGDAFVNFRQILGDITLHPIMGKYLDMKGNNKASPNENYAREIMQLFSIGLYMLHPDGTLMLDGTGRPLPTYTQPIVTSFAQVYTGWDSNNTNRPVIPRLIPPVAPATQPTVSNLTSSYQRPMVVNPANHSTGQKTLLTYPGVVTIPPSTTPGVIAANAKQTAATAQAELDAALDNIFNHPNVGPFICRQLIQRLVESNPSPAYVYRVGQVFNNDGTGVRGNMRAVITAILTDYEARSPNVRNDAGYGHMREPIVRLASLLHSLNAVSKSGKWVFGKTDATLAQTILRSPTVFNFFDPAYAQPGVVQGAGIVSPEFNIIYETTVTNAQNMIYTGIYATYNADGSPKLPSAGTGFRGDSGGSDIYLDFSTAGNGLVALAQTGGSSAALNQAVLLLSGAPLDTDGAAQARIQQFLTSSLGTATPLAQVQAAVHLVATSPQCAAQK